MKNTPEFLLSLLLLLLLFFIYLYFNYAECIFRDFYRFLSIVFNNKQLTIVIIIIINWALG